eukprot:TRINITY_DN2026_c0_g1_i1.p1 TRINITY_DN2026_c0_g1~~TRINITY_DN2026_c0_g1_i1.p1  ORF type:complete len:105 (+),score=18.04 TRINITY_DN2026_c0_g1_i1:146-460(+)
MSNRDYVFSRTRKQIDEEKTIMLFEATEHPSAPETKDNVRVTEFTQYFLTKKLTEESAEYFMICGYDLKGNIPSLVMNWAIGKGIPSFLSKLLQACQSYTKEKK